MLKILLTQDVEHVGSLGDEVQVKPGFARNFLIPGGKAVDITSAGAKRILHHKKKLEETRRHAIMTAEELAKKIEELDLVFVMKSAEGGKLFGAINTKQIIEELEKNAIVLTVKNALSSEHIKQVGSYVLPVKLHSTVRANLKVKIEAEKVEVKEPAKGADGTKKRGKKAEEKLEEAAASKGKEQPAEQEQAE